VRNPLLPGRLLLLALALAAAASPLVAYDPPSGGLLQPILGSPVSSGGGASPSYLEAPWADRLNPAASATQQRPVLDAGYGLLADFGSQGIGTALNLGLSLPQPYGVWGGGFSFLSTPTSMSDLPLGTLFQFRGGLAKALFPNFSIGASLDTTLGWEKNFGWGLGLNLGAVHRLGDLGPLLDFRYGAVLSGIGLGYSPSAAPATAFPAPFTLSGGARALLVRSRDWKLGFGLDLSFPTFQDLGFGLSASLAWKDQIQLRMGWGLPSVRELGGGSTKSLLPSVGLMGSFSLNRAKDESFISKNGWDQSELRPALSFTPLYGKIAQYSAGLTIPLGVVDREAPVITVAFPTTKWGPAYVSPNSDGKADSVDFPVTITDRRYIASWNLSVTREGGHEALRSIANKESRPVALTLAGLWQRLLYVEKGVPVPATLSWNGFSDKGEPVPDGNYEIRLEAADDNDNVAVAGPFKVVVDTQAPSAKIEPKADLIFSPDGDGNKDSLPLGITGSKEDLWSLDILDAGGNKVRHLDYTDSTPQDFEWDGKNDAGAIVPDGVYALVLASTDRASNSFRTRLDNILVNTRQPPINLAIDGSAFSPNGDGVKDGLTLMPNVPVRTGLLSWKLEALDKNRASVWQSGGSDAARIPERLVWDGKTNSGAALPEGSYQARLTVTYNNGYSPFVLSPSFVIDLTPPSATVKADLDYFNPSGSGGQSQVTFTQKAGEEARWTGEILGADGKVRRTWSWNGLPEASLVWDGSDDAGALVPDGAYSYRLGGVDRAGNSFSTEPLKVSLDTVKKDLRIAADLRAFSPNGDGVKDAVRFSATVKAPDTVRSWTLSILPAADNGEPLAGVPALRSFRGQKPVPEATVWDGTAEGGQRAPEGRYLALLGVDWANGDRAEARSLPVLLDTVAPSIKISASPLLFAPNGTSRLQSTTISQKSVAGDDWTGTLRDQTGATVRLWSWKGEAQNLVWDGTDDSGNKVKDGSYTYSVTSTDAAGNTGSASVPAITVDARVPQVFVTASAPGLSPNGDGFMDDISFSFIVNLKEGISSWRFALEDATGTERASFSGKGSDLPPRLVWDGKTSTGASSDGTYVGVLSVDYAKGDLAVARTGSIAVDTTPPAVDFSITPDWFSPDNDGVDDELAMGIAVKDASPIGAWKLDIVEKSVEEGPTSVSRERLFASWSGNSTPASRITWDGRSSKGELVESATDYPLRFEVSDIYGNKTSVKATIAVDVLVIREGDRLKIKVPSIVFRPDFSDFEGLTPAVVANNRKVVSRIAEILNKFKDYRIAIEGHANSIGKIYGYTAAKINDEETKELIPLSTNRAEAVRRLLVADGVDPRRLTVLGLGSSDPVVDFKDAVNRWKNRRVEFILIKSAAPAPGSGG